MSDINATTDDAVSQIIAGARATSGDSSQSASLDAAVQAAAPDQRSAASKLLVDETAARDALHASLQRLGIER